MALEDINISQEDFEILQPIIVIARTLGTFPVKYVKHGSQYKLKKSLGCMVYSYTLTIVLIALSFYGVLGDLQACDNFTVRTNDEKMRFVMYRDLFTIMIISVWAAMTLPLKMKHLWRLLPRLNQLIMLSNLIHLVMAPYFLYNKVTKPKVNVSLILLLSSLILTHIGQLLLIVEPCQQCLNEHQQTLSLVYQLLTEDLSENVKESLKMFAMQLNYYKIRFSACGLFKIDRSLVTSVAAAVATYLIILFQFNITQ